MHASRRGLTVTPTLPLAAVDIEALASEDAPGADGAMVCAAKAEPTETKAANPTAAPTHSVLVIPNPSEPLWGSL